MKVSNFMMRLTCASAVVMAMACTRTAETGSSGVPTTTNGAKVDEQKSGDANKSTQPVQQTQVIQQQPVTQQQQPVVQPQAQTPAPVATPQVAAQGAPPTDPTVAVIYNYQKDPITNINGRSVSVPQGHWAAVQKVYSDVTDDTNMYELNIQTASGKVVNGEFNATDVDDAQWKASVSDEGGQLAVKQNAGGGGGGGGGASGKRSLTNFVDDED